MSEVKYFQNKSLGVLTRFVQILIEEGYGRGYGKQFLQFYGYSLGSARETKGHLYRAKAFYDPETLQKRLHLASEVVALLITEINRQRAH